MNLIHISTSIRSAFVWVDGYERAALATYHRQPGEIIHAVRRI